MIRILRQDGASVGRIRKHKSKIKEYLLDRVDLVSSYSIITLEDPSQGVICFYRLRLVQNSYFDQGFAAK